jgi:hypothetical protein
MFPIPSDRKLSVVEISRHWSREIQPPASAQELREVIIKAWWCGELTAANSSSRLSVLRGYYLRSAPFVAFAIPDAEEPAQWDTVGEGVIDFVRPLRVPLPNTNLDTWTEANCTPAFNAIAEGWNEDMLSQNGPIALGIVLTSGEFFQWIDACDYKRPTFWSRPAKRTDPENPDDGSMPKIDIGKVEPKTAKSRAAWEALTASWPNGPPANLKTADIHRKVNKWIEKQPRTKYSFIEVSRETVARLLRRKGNGQIGRWAGK